jgi:hypothetical protein
VTSSKPPPPASSGGSGDSSADDEALVDEVVAKFNCFARRARTLSTAVDTSILKRRQPNPQKQNPNVKTPKDSFTVPFL